MTAQPTESRRDELLAIAARLFAEKGFRNTTVRDIADAAGILSGSLYHHFDSKESMVDEILSTFQEELFGQYDGILASSDLDPLVKLEQAVVVSFEAIDKHRDEVAIFQNEAAHLLTFDRFAYLADRNQQSREVWLTLLRNGQPDSAIVEYKEALRLEPNSAATLSNLGYAWMIKGDPQQAIEFLKCALRLSPDDAAARANLATAYRAAGMPDSAALVEGNRQ